MEEDIEMRSGRAGPSFSVRPEKEGPARPERVPIFLPCNQKGKRNAEILRNGCILLK